MAAALFKGRAPDCDVTMELSLTTIAQASSWGSLLRAYEAWAIDANRLHHEFCAQLMRELPTGLMSKPSPPAALYHVLRNMAGQQIGVLDELLGRKQSEPSRATQMRRFWTITLPAALERKFPGVNFLEESNLLELEHAVAR